MIYTPLTDKAMKKAYQAHHGQFDKNGTPYIFHPFHLAEQMEDEITVCAALLHDVLEDTALTLEDLEKEFPREVTEALQLLTHKDSMDYFDYIRAIKKNPVARAVKTADIIHNSDESRLTDPDAVTKEKRLYWRQKYKKAMDILNEPE